MKLPLSLFLIFFSVLGLMIPNVYANPVTVSGISTEIIDGVTHYYPTSVDTSTTFPDGTEIKTDVDGTQIITLPDGTIIKKIQGNTKLKTYSGSTVVSIPVTSKIIITYSDGTVITKTSMVLNNGFGPIELVVFDSRDDEYPKTQESSTSNLIPSWFKNNARWWQEGIISDTEIVNALESLLIQDIIPLDKFLESHPGLEHEAGVEKGGTFEITPEFPSHPGLEHESGVQSGGTFVTIPEYQKNVFGYWSEGLVSDGEIVNSIGHLMSTGIISSEKIKEKVQEKIEEKTRDEFGRPESGPTRDSNSGTFHILGTNVLIGLYETQKLNELSFNLLLDVKNAESVLLKKASVIAWDDYANEQTSEKATRAQSIEKLSDKTSSDALFVVKQLSKLKDDMEQTKTYAKTLNLNLEEFDQIDYEIDTRIENLPKMSSMESIKSGAKELQKIQKETNTSLQNSLSLILTDAFSKNLENSDDIPKLQDYLNKQLSDVTFSNIDDIDTLSDIIGPPTGEIIFEDDFEFVLIHPTDGEEELPESAGLASPIIFFETIFGIDDDWYSDTKSDQLMDIVEKESSSSYSDTHELIDEISDEVDISAEQLQHIVVLIGDGFADENSEFSAPEEPEPTEEPEPVENSQTSNNTGDISIKILNIQGVYAPIVQFSIQSAGYCPESYSPYFGAILDVNGAFVDLDASQHAGATPTCQIISTSHHSVSDIYVTQEQIDNFISETNYYGIPMDPRDGKFYGQ